MIIVDGQKLRFLLAGRVLTVDVHRAYRKGRDYAVGKTHRKATCRAIVESCEQTGGKTWRITVRYAREHKPVYLAANPAGQRADYTDNPAKAARAADGPMEAADRVELERYAKRARENDTARRRQVVADTPLEERVRQLQKRARLGDQEAQRALFSIGSRVERVERGLARRVDAS